MSPHRTASEARETVYLDHAATSPLRPGVWEAMSAARGEADYNPSSAHGDGQRARHHLEDARARLADVLGGEKGTLHFTGGGTQSDNLAVLGFARAHRDRSPRILVSAVEHRAVLESARQAEREGARVEVVPVDDTGTLRLDALADRLGEDGEAPVLVSVMWGNNEVGTIQPVERVAALAREHGARFHTDAVQALGKVPVSLEEVPADLLTVTAHKLGGPVGIGLLHVGSDVEIAPLTHGGTQEGGLWPGTQNPLGAVGFAEAAGLLAEDLPGSTERWGELRDGLEARLREAIPGLRVHGGDAPERLPHILNVGIPGCDTATLLLSLDMEGISVSSGSACSSGSEAPSHVLEAMGVYRDAPEEYGVLRFSLGPETTREQVERAASAVVRVVERVRDGAARVAT
jgi:cysteine desulfurase